MEGASVTDGLAVESGQVGLDAGIDATSDGMDATSDGMEATSEASVDAQGDGPSWVDDPCPSQPPDVNCSTSCGGPNAACQTFACPMGIIARVGLPPYVLRTPSHPVGHQTCITCAVNYSMTFSIDWGQFPNGILVTVGPPWKISSEDPCSPPIDSGGCGYLPNGFGILSVWTDDPTAPARNIVITAATPGQNCH
jgi:hypothetical protein